MAPNVKIALIQMYSDVNNPPANFEKAVSYLRKAAAQGAELAVLPEYHISSWEPESKTFLASPSLSAGYLEQYRQLAKELNLCIVPGTLLEPTPEGGIANVCYFIDNKGEILGRYQKKNLWHPERPVLTADAETPHIAFDTPFGKVGLIICWDLIFNESFRELIVQGAKMVICVSWWIGATPGDPTAVLNPECEALLLETTAISRANENTCAFVYANCGAPPGRTSDDAGIEFAGVSQVAMPLVGALGKLGKGEDMSVVDVDMGILDVAEEAYKIREDMKKEAWHYKHTLRELEK